MNAYFRTTLCLIGVCLMGCGGDEGPPAAARGKVTGKVTVKGEALSKLGLGLNFMTADASDTVNIKEDGTYEGEAPVGDCKVFVVVVGTPDGGHVPADEMGVLPGLMEEETSTLSANVSDGENNFDFEIGQ